MPKRRKITDAQVVELRTRRAAGESLNSLAEAFGLIPQYVSYVCRGKIHKGAGGPITEPYSVFANARSLEHDGVTLSETKWAKRAGLTLSAVASRLHRGWSVEDALTTRHRNAPSEILTPPGPSIAYVVLNEGQFACIDTETIPLVKDDLWYVVKDPKYGRMYPATHRSADGEDEFVSMRTVVLGSKPTTSYAVNWNNLDCEKRTCWTSPRRSLVGGTHRAATTRPATQASFGAKRRSDSSSISRRTASPSGSADSTR